MLGTLNVLAMVLGARLVVLVAVVGAIALTWTALVSPDPFKLGVLAIYGAAVVLPSIWLAGRR